MVKRSDSIIKNSTLNIKNSITPYIKNISGNIISDALPHVFNYIDIRALHPLRGTHTQEPKPVCNNNLYGLYQEQPCLT